VEEENPAGEPYEIYREEGFGTKGSEQNEKELQIEQWA